HGLRDDLAAENTLPADAGARTSKEIDLDRLQIERRHQTIHGGGIGLFGRHFTATPTGRNDGGDALYKTGMIRDTRGAVAMMDMLVVGGGYVGLAAAVAVKQAAPHLDIAVVEAAPEHVWKRDMRASAIIAAAARMLEVFGVWEEIREHAQPIN